MKPEDKAKVKQALKTIWDWVGSKSYWRLSAVLTGSFLTIAALGKTDNWYFAASMAFGFFVCWTFSRKAALDAIYTTPPAQPAVPEGYKLVPMEPTEEMINAALADRNYSGGVPGIYYRAMLGAAPKQKGTP
jgi:hypothetical protein